MPESFSTSDPTLRPFADELFDDLDLEDIRPSRGIGCRIGYLRHLLLTNRGSQEELVRLARSIPGLERYLIEGARRAYHARSKELKRFADLLERWGNPRTEYAIGLFERRLFGRRDRRRAAS